MYGEKPMAMANAKQRGMKIKDNPGHESGAVQVRHKGRCGDSS
jgi:hypothetical protein